MCLCVTFSYTVHSHRRNFSVLTAKLRESTFIMLRGGGMKMLRGGTEIFSDIKGGALKVLDILKGGGGL
jgi:hypothetical protein